MYSEGIYKVSATRWGWRETSGGNPLFWMVFNVLGVMEPNRLDGEPKSCEPCTARWSISPTTDKSEDWLRHTLQSLGYDRDDLLGLDPESDNAFDFEGVQFLARCKHEEYNGQTRERWSVVTPPSKLSADKLRALNERFGRKFKDANVQQAPKEGSATGKTTQAPALEEEEPF